MTINTDLKFDRATKNRTICRKSRNVIYAIGRNSSDSKVTVSKSTDGGASFVAKDVVNAPTTNGLSVCAALGTDNIIHLFYERADAAAYVYTQFNTSTDTYSGVIEVLDIPAGFVIGGEIISIAIDSSNIPHVVYFSNRVAPPAQQLLYNNRIGGSWNVPAVIVEAFSGGNGPNTAHIIINESNIPEIGYITVEATVNAKAAVGNVNDATSFTLFTLTTVAKTNSVVSLALNTAGDTLASYSRTDVPRTVAFRKHLNADPWGTWQTEVVLSDNEGSNVVNPYIVFRNNLIRIYYGNTDETKLKYFESSNGGISFGSPVTWHTGTVLRDPVTRWNNYEPSGISSHNDVIFDDAPAGFFFGDQQFTQIDPAGTMAKERSICRKTGSIIYVVWGRAATSKIVVSKSTDGGLTFVTQDSVNAPTSTTGVSATLGTNGIIHIFYRTSTALEYTQFNTTTDTYSGTIETLDIPTGFIAATSETTVANDSNNVPHVVYSVHRVSPNEDRLLYNNRMGGIWNTSSLVIETLTGGGFTFIREHIIINEDNIPEICYLSEEGPNNVKAAVGNANDATSFSLFTASTVGRIGNEGVSLAINNLGDTLLSYAKDTTPIKIGFRKHLDSDAWETWQAEVELTDNEGLNILSPYIVFRNNVIRIYYNNPALTKLKYFESSDGGTSFKGPLILYVSSAIHHPVTRFNLYEPSGISGYQDIVFDFPSFITESPPPQELTKTFSADIIASKPVIVRRTTQIQKGKRKNAQIH